MLGGPQPSSQCQASVTWIMENGEWRTGTLAWLCQGVAEGGPWGDHTMYYVSNQNFWFCFRKFFSRVLSSQGEGKQSLIGSIGTLEHFFAPQRNWTEMTKPNIWWRSNLDCAQNGTGFRKIKQIHLFFVHTRDPARNFNYMAERGGEGGKQEDNLRKSRHMSSQWVQQELFFLVFMVSHRKEI